MRGVVDHLGKRFNSVADMCRYWNVTYNTYLKRIDSGWSLRDSLTIKDRTVIDHLGNSFKTVRDMCEYWGISLWTYEQRIKAGWSLEDALTRKIQTHKIGKLCKDHLGNEFNSIKEMCNYWKINVYTYRSRIKSGLSVKTALTTAVVSDLTTCNCKTCKDHLGNEFSSITKMCNHWGIPIRAYEMRISRGWSLKDSLTKSLTPRNEPCGDHLGNSFINIKSMCEYWHVDYRTYRNRRSRGWSLKAALTGTKDCESDFQLDSI